MARSAPALSTFSAGEISPRLEGRVSLDKYREGLSELTNMIVQPHGGVTRRPGTEYLGEVKDSTRETRLIPFEFKTSDTYALEFGNQYMRVFRNGLQVLEASEKTVTAITLANPGVFTSTAHGLSDGDEVYLYNDGSAMTEMKERNYRVANATANTFTLTDLFGNDIDTTDYTAFDAYISVDRIYEIATPYLTADLHNIRFAQSADVMYIVHPSHHSRTLSRYDHNDWRLDGVFLGEPLTAKSITGVTKANPGVVTVSSHGFFNGDAVKISGIVGMTELNNKYFYVANATTNTFTLKDVENNDIDTTSYTTYSSGGTAQKIQASVPALWGAANNPSVVTFFEQRLVFGATSNNPQALWFSKSADYLNFTVGTADDAALIYTIASNKVNAIRYLSATRVLIIGTSGGEYVLTTTNGGPVTPTTTVIRKYSNYGCTNDEPVQVADTTLFIQRGGRKVREFRYAGEIDTGGYAAPDITILAEHLTEGGILQFAYQQEPESLIWALRNDGTLLGLTYRREEQVVAWHKHIIGGSFNGGQAVVESVMSLPTDSGEDELYIIVKRTINGATKRYVEVLKTFDFGSDTTSAFFVDSGLVYSGSSVGSVTGAYHLEGETVSILANGATHADKSVSSGGVTFDFNITSGAIGFGFTSQMQTLRLEAGSVDGTSQGKPKRIHAVTLRIDETVGLEVGPDADSLDRIYFRDSSMAMDTAVPLFTGDKEIEFPGGFDDDAKIFVRQNQPLPMTILAIYPRLNTFDK
jgi:hypothetical protein